ncbi:serpentine type 7TM GPCR chemoreceptor srt domain-containing protein [Ditylenchus destructor]|nr:serpentine type 7TM GPCR chemoreceptor srt domain-containing protein [Ditylenchus destructor]
MNTITPLNAWEIPPPKNNFSRFPTLWNYDNHYDRYCTNGMTVLWKQNVLVGSIYCLTYLFYMSIYVPVLIVIRRSNLYQHTSYKLMFGIGIVDNINGFVFTFMAGVMSITGINYCDNNAFLTFMGHLCHSCWGTYSMFVVVLALNRCIEMFSKNVSESLFGGKRLYFWGIPIFTWFWIFTSNWDVPPIYSSYLNTWIFTIDLRPGAPPVNDWVCFLSSWFVISSLIVLYTLLLYAMHRHSRKCVEKEKFNTIQKKVFIQTFWICFTVFIVDLFFGLNSWIRLPEYLASLNTWVLHICTGSPGIVYLMVNKTIRGGVISLIFGKKNAKVDSRPNITSVTTGKVQIAVQDQIDSCI